MQIQRLCLLPFFWAAFLTIASGQLPDIVSNPDYVKAIEVQLNEDLGLDEESDDYINLIPQGEGSSSTNLPAGSKAILLYLTDKRTGDGTVSQAHDNGAIDIYFEDVFEITMDPFDPEGDWPDWFGHIHVFSLLLLHELQHLPTDGGGEDLPGGTQLPRVLPGGVPGEGTGEPLNCKHLALHVESHRQGCAKVSILMASHSPPDTDNCTELDLLCKLLEASAKKVQDPELNTPAYIADCSTETPYSGGWIHNCVFCDSWAAGCLPGITWNIQGNEEVEDLNHYSTPPTQPL